MPRLYNLHSHKALRKQLRRQATLAERRLWRFLKNDQFHGFRFRRQFSVGRYILDFYCPKLRLAVEIDGDIHQLSAVKENDIVRQQYIESCWIRVVRFTNDEVMNDIEYVLKVLAEKSLPPKSPF